MSIASTIRRAGPFEGNGVSVAFPFGFRVFEGSEVLVVRSDANGNETPLALGNDYSITLNFDQDVTPGGVIHYPLAGPALPVGQRIAATSAVLPVQPASLTNQGGFFPKVIEKGLDRLTIVVQQMLERLSRTPYLPLSDPGSVSVPDKATRAGRMWAFDSAGNLVFIIPADGSVGTLALDLAAADSASKGVGQLGVDMALSYGNGLGKFLGYLHARTVGEIAAGVTPTNYAFTEGDIRRYGALTAAANNAPAINAALLVSANGGADAFIPPGTWAYTATVTATLSSSMHGCGQLSILAPNGVDGITFTTQPTYGGSRNFRDFVIAGTSTGAKAGIKSTMLAASGHRVTSVFFDRLTIENFLYPIDIQGFWNSGARDCHFYNCYHGPRLTERNVKFTFSNVHCVKGSITGTGDQYGMMIDQVGGIRPESITLRGCFLYGYDYALAIGNALYTVVDHCDFDNCQKGGAVITTANGGTSIRDCWINTNNAGVATIGIDVSALGAANKDSISIENCQISCTQANVGSVGVKVGSNQFAVTHRGGRVNGFATGVSCSATTGFVTKEASINAVTTAVSMDSNAIDCTVGPHYIEGGTPLAFSAGTPTGLLYFARGSFTLTLTGMTGSVTGTVTWTANGREIRLEVPTTSSLTGTSNSTAMTGTGLPTVLRPRVSRISIPTVIDQGLATHAYGSVSSSTGVITFGGDANGGNFTNSGTKGLAAGSFAYAYS